MSQSWKVSFRSPGDSLSSTAKEKCSEGYSNFADKKEINNQGKRAVACLAVLLLVRERNILLCSAGSCCFKIKCNVIDRGYVGKMLLQDCNIARDSFKSAQRAALHVRLHRVCGLRPLVLRVQLSSDIYWLIPCQSKVVVHGSQEDYYFDCDLVIIKLWWLTVAKETQPEGITLGVAKPFTLSPPNLLKKISAVLKPQFQLAAMMLRWPYICCKSDFLPRS